MLSGKTYHANFLSSQTNGLKVYLFLVNKIDVLFYQTIYLGAGQSVHFSKLNANITDGLLHRHIKMHPNENIL